eukprot:TRINITY_DN3547_c0_g1_i1.p2 TRINITY_DN3547_c0_g1~~TRINITY_DN3547_c0_g1_i1.p2  ORF type:complete len:124 (-),score=26.35 TRINITY_DN3547_c0_g1_i1:184-555(-)
MFLVQYFTSNDEKNELMKMFQALDLNGDGVLSREELLTGYQKYLPEDQAIQYVNDIMKQIDKNNNGEIDYMEFVMATCNRRKMLQLNNLEAAFEMFDKVNKKHPNKLLFFSKKKGWKWSFRCQ